MFHQTNLDPENPGAIDCDVFKGGNCQEWVSADSTPEIIHQDLGGRPKSLTEPLMETSFQIYGIRESRSDMFEDEPDQ